MTPTFPPIPPEAEPVIALIRKHVARPKRLPKFYKPDEIGVGNGRLLFYCGGRKQYACMLGLSRDSDDGSPTGKAWFHYGSPFNTSLTDIEFNAATCWWDSIPERFAAEAVDAVWGKKDN
jgi:hypothetical protein